jgi:hypothetical protein
MSLKETYDYNIKVTANLSQARAGLTALQDMLLGGNKLAGALNSTFGKTALTLFSVYEATKLTLRGMQALTRGVMEFQTATARLQAMGFTPRSMAEMVRASQSLSLTGRSVISTAGFIDIQSTLAARGIRGSAATNLMRQIGLQAESLTGQTGNAAASKDMAMQIAQATLTMTAFRKRNPEEIKSLDETLFRLSETMKEQFPGFIESVSQLSGTFPRLTAGGLKSMAAMSMLTGNPELAAGMAAELRDFSLGTNVRQALPFMAMSKLFKISPEAALIRGRPFQLKDQFQNMIQQDPTRFLSEVLIPGLEKTGLSPTKTISTIQQVFGPDSDIARAARLIIENHEAYRQDRKVVGAGLSSTTGAGQANATSIADAWAQFNTALQSLTHNLQLPGVLTAIHALTGLVTMLGNFSKDNPKTAGGIFEAGSAAGGILSFFGLRKLFKSVFGSKAAAAAGEGGGEAEATQAAKSLLTRTPTAGGSSLIGSPALGVAALFGTLVAFLGAASYSNSRKDTATAQMQSQLAEQMHMLNSLAGFRNLTSSQRKNIASLQTSYVALSNMPNEPHTLLESSLFGQGNTDAQLTLLLNAVQNLVNQLAAEQSHVTITVQDDHGHAMKHIVKSIHRAARNSTTAAGTQMAPILNGSS